MNIALLVSSLHTNSWAIDDDLKKYLIIRRGGRQGCKIGSMVFNFAYKRALDALNTAMDEEGLQLHLRYSPEGAPWDAAPAADAAGAREATIADATFVDDDAIIIFAKTVGAI